MSERVKLPDSTQLDTLNGKLESINTTLAGQGFVTKENVVAALGGEPEMKLGEYELLNDITVAEDTQTFVYSQDDNGEAYNLKAVKIIVACYNGQMNKWINWSLRNTQGALLTAGQGSLVANTTGNVNYYSTTLLKSTPISDYWENMSAAGGQGMTMSMVYPPSAYNQFDKVTSNIGQINFSIYSGVLIANSTVKIYGVRA